MSDSLQPHEPQHARPPCPVLHLMPWSILSCFCISCETWVEEVYFFLLWMSTCSTTVLVSWEGEGLWLTKCPTLADLNNGHLFSHSSGSQKSKSKVAAWLQTPSESMRKTSPGFSPRLRGLPVILCSLDYKSIILTSACIFREMVSPCFLTFLSLCVWLSLCSDVPYYNNTSYIELEITLVI